MSLIYKLEPITHLYDQLQQIWDKTGTRRVLALTIFWVYMLLILGVELNRIQLLPPSLAAAVPVNHFYAIHMAFTLILGIEVMGLILTLSLSLSRSLYKQLEILALILLRNAFKELTVLPEPVNLADNPEPILHIAVIGSTALAIFVCMGLYGRLRQSHNYITNPRERMGYVISKKLLALGLLLVFVSVGIRDIWLFIAHGIETPFFETIYTVLIFSDIALVLIAQRYMPTFHAVFRNSAFVIATLIMRLSLAAAWPWDVAASLFAAIYVLALTWATNYFAPEMAKPRQNRT